MTVPLVLTRARPDADALAARLASTGRTVWVAPCIELEPIALPADTLDRWRGQPVRLALTSPHAVPALARLRWDPAWELHALAPTTSAAARAAGFTVHREVRGGAAALARGTADRPLILVGSNLAGSEAARANPAVVHLIGYRTSIPTGLDLPPGPFDVFFASPSAVHGFVALAGAARDRVRYTLAHGATTVATARQAGLTSHPCSVEDLFHATTPPSPSH